MNRTYYCFCEDNCKFETMTKEQILAAIAQAAETGLVFDADAAFITQIKEINAGGLVKFWVGTQAQWNAIAEKDANCFPIFTDDTEYPTMAQAVAAAVNHMRATNNPHNVTAEQVGAAPDGYGWGNHNMARKETYGADANNITETGLYAVDSTVANIPHSLANFIFAHAKGLNYIAQTCFVFLDNGWHKATRYGDAKGTWHPWLWEIPPMYENEAYLTTERFDGRSVQTKLIDCGALPASNSFKTIEDVCPAGARVVGLDVYICNENKSFVSKMPYFNSEGTLEVSAWMASGTLRLQTFASDISNYHAFAVVKYLTY